MLSEKWYHIAEYMGDEYHKSLQCVHISIVSILAEYLHIDLGKLEEEKQQMLDEIRKMNKNG